MANYNATGKKSKRGAELVQRSRAAILNALDVVEEGKKTISQLLAVEFEKNPIKFMELASKFAPKEVADVTESYRAADLDDDQLADIATGSSPGASTAQTSTKAVH